MGFRYSFQKIVDLKENEKTQAEWILSHAVVKLQDEETTLSTLYNEKNELHEQIISAASSATNISQLMLYQSYMNHLQEAISRKFLDVQNAKQNVNHKKEFLTEKLKEEKVWIKARERAHLMYTEEQRKKEQVENDEIATNRHRRLS